MFLSWKVVCICIFTGLIPYPLYISQKWESGPPCTRSSPHIGFSICTGLRRPAAAPAAESILNLFSSNCCFSNWTSTNKHTFLFVQSFFNFWLVGSMVSWIIWPFAYFAKKGLSVFTCQQGLENSHPSSFILQICPSTTWSFVTMIKEKGVGVAASEVLAGFSQRQVGGKGEKLVLIFSRRKWRPLQMSHKYADTSSSWTDFQHQKGNTTFFGQKI